MKPNLELFETFYSKYYDSLKNSAILRVHNAVVAEDIVQNVFMQVLGHIGWWNGLGDASKISYMWRTLDGFCRNFIENKPYTLEYRDSLSEEKDDLYGYLCEGMDLYNCINELRDRDRAVIVEFYYNHKSLKDIADILGDTQDNVNHILSRSRKRLKKVIDRNNL